MGDRIKIVLIGILAFILAASLVYANSHHLSCQVTPDCAGTSVFKVSSPSNAHAEVYNSSNYNLSVCCSTSKYELNRSCNTTGFSMLKLSQETNAHVEISNFSNFPVNACLSFPDANISCEYTAQNCADAGYHACATEISSLTNAHASACTNTFPAKVCCKSICRGSVSGVIQNDANESVSSAEVSVKDGLATIASATTDGQGHYSISGIDCGTYNIVITHAVYLPRSISNVEINPGKNTDLDFTSNSTSGSLPLVLGSSCEPDCTFASDIIVHASCDGKNGCGFFDDTAKAACDNSQPGWARDYSSSHYVVCPSGAPQPKIEIQASVTCSSGTLVKAERVFIYNGEPVRLVVAICG